MSPYNAYSPSLSSSRLSSYTPTSRSYTGSDSYSSLSSTSSYRYKPPAYSSTLSAKYRSPSTYSLTNSYSSSTLPRNVSSSSLATRVPKFNSVSSYTGAILNTSDYKWKSPTTTNDLLWRSPSLSRRNSSSSLVSSSHTPERSSRLSLPAYTASIEKIPAYKVNSWSCDKSEDVEDRRGVRVGLNNLGNTCFMNAVLQCLCHTQPLVDYCIRGTYLSDINHRSPTHGDLVKVFADFVKKISDSNSKSAISPYQLRTEVQRYAPRFSGDHQQDAQEFLRYLLQGLHDDLNRVKCKPSLKGDYGGDAFKTWRRYKDTDDSLIVGDNCSYVLYGVVDHDGSNNSGHYIAKCRNPCSKEWNEFNDSRVTNAMNIVTNKSYILFYIQEGTSYF
ncbi:ubiquitin carboxyl-terminal hydrolase 2 [Nephila pilipes]|uniref:Ubiquitin carboxyl-terminal hydrolase n=1 Tax=Nephila pilipes TaxID=299642 RepID=A0A8X6UEX8_NEPPI|nr:ubiquitin carboxyl-terminal hydrolase 2 [Nephila pilipes]